MLADGLTVPEQACCYSWQSTTETQAEDWLESTTVGELAAQVATAGVPTFPLQSPADSSQTVAHFANRHAMLPDLQSCLASRRQKRKLSAVGALAKRPILPFSHSALPVAPLPHLPAPTPHGRDPSTSRPYSTQPCARTPETVPLLAAPSHTAEFTGQAAPPH